MRYCDSFENASNIQKFLDDYIDKKKRIKTLFELLVHTKDDALPVLHFLTSPEGELLSEDLRQNAPSVVMKKPGLNGIHTSWFPLPYAAFRAIRYPKRWRALEALAWSSEFQSVFVENKKGVGCPTGTTPLGLAALAVFCNRELFLSMGNPYGVVGTNDNNTFCFWDVVCGQAKMDDLMDQAFDTSETLMSGPFSKTKGGQRLKEGWVWALKNIREPVVWDENHAFIRFLKADWGLKTLDEGERESILKKPFFHKAWLDEVISNPIRSGHRPRL